MPGTSRSPEIDPRTLQQLQELLDGGQLYISRIPETPQDWLLERNLLMQAWYDEQQRRQAFLIGKAPETPEDRELELRMRRLQWQTERDFQDRELRAKKEDDQVKTARDSERIRGWVVIGIVAAIIATPVVAMFKGVPPEEFGQYIAPVTGIAGSVIGYWFGMRTGDSTSTETRGSGTPAVGTADATVDGTTPNSAPAPSPLPLPPTPPPAPTPAPISEPAPAPSPLTE